MNKPFNPTAAHPSASIPLVTRVVRPAGASHETLYVVLFCLLVLACAGAVVALHREEQTQSIVQPHQLDARLDLTPGEQGIYADLRVTLDEVRLLREEHSELPSTTQLADEGFAPFAQDTSAVSRGAHQWSVVNGEAYLGLSQQVATAGSFLLRVNAANQPTDIWLNRKADLAAPGDLSNQALIGSGWKHIVARFDAGVTRQHRH